MQVSHSRVECFNNCPFQYKLKYIDKFRTYFNHDPTNALILGTALHTGLEKDVESAIKQYYDSYNIISDLHVNEAMKLEYLIPRIKELLPDGEYEVKLENDYFIGYIDLLAPVDDNTYDLYDFKYSNNVANYMQSGQLHEYKYFFELLNPGKRIRNLYFVFVPKTMIRQKKTEDLYQFRQRLQATLESFDLSKDSVIKKVEYDENKVSKFVCDAAFCMGANEFPKKESRLCDWCEFKDYCRKGDTVEIYNYKEEEMLLPKNEKRELSIASKKKIWIYGPPFSGKTTLTDKFPDLLILSTDENVQNVTAPYIHIKDTVWTEGRAIKRKYAWEMFKEVIEELEKKENDYKSISLDLLEDTRDMCRIYMYDKLGIQHESDSGFGKAYDQIRLEYLGVMKRFFNLDYDNILACSHEDQTKSITKKSGEQITRIAPNLQDALATKIAGMVDLVCRVVVDDEDKRTISFKADNVIFGGGRLGVTGQEIPLNYDALMEVYNRAVENMKSQNGVKTEATKTTDTPRRASR